MGALDGVRVIEATEGIAGGYAGKLLADQGAQVVKVERPGGDPLRRWSAARPDEPVDGTGALFQFLTAGKQVVDRADPADADVLLAGPLTDELLGNGWRDLVRADLVKSFRGPHGGFMLARDARSITLLDIVNAVDPIRRIDGCPLEDPRYANLCPLHQCLDDALAHMEQRLRSTTLGCVLGTLREAGSCRSLLSGSPQMPSRECS